MSERHHTQQEHADHLADHHAGHHAGHHTGQHGGSGLNAMAISATLHCLTGCAIGEVLGLIIGTALGLATGWTIALAVGLAFLFGYALSTLPLLSAGLGLGAALSVVLAADTLSIATMEVVDNAVMALVPGAMDAGLVNPVFWLSMSLALTVAFFAAWPVNRVLIARGKGHALTHEYHHGHGDDARGSSRRIPAPSTGMLVTAIVAFMLGGLVVSTAAELEGDEAADPAPAHAAP
jgi:Domain of unknown function (DUF4396)